MRHALRYVGLRLGLVLALLLAAYLGATVFVGCATYQYEDGEVATAVWRVVWYDRLAHNLGAYTVQHRLTGACALVIVGSGGVTTTPLDPVNCRNLGRD